MLPTASIHWLAGFVEGEGCISDNRGTPALIIGSTDKDVMVHASQLLGVNLLGPYQYESSGNKKPFWKATVHGSRAAGWMMTLYSLLGERRRERIREVLAVWRDKPVWQRYRTKCPRGHEYTEDNTYYNGNRRVCRTCQLYRMQTYRARRVNAPKMEQER